MHFKQLEQLTKDSFNLSTIVYAEETEQSVLDNLMHPGVQAVNSIKVEHYSQKSRYPFGCLLFCYTAESNPSQCKCPVDAFHKCIAKKSNCAMITPNERQRSNLWSFVVIPSGW